MMAVLQLLLSQVRNPTDSHDTCMSIPQDQEILHLPPPSRRSPNSPAPDNQAEQERRLRQGRLHRGPGLDHGRAHMDQLGHGADPGGLRELLGGVGVHGLREHAGHAGPA